MSGVAVMAEEEVIEIDLTQLRKMKVRDLQYDDMYVQLTMPQYLHDL